jgi:hypothetical protein
MTGARRDGAGVQDLETSERRKKERFCGRSASRRMR